MISNFNQVYFRINDIRVYSRILMISGYPIEIVKKRRIISDTWCIFRNMNFIIAAAIITETAFS